MSLKKLRKLAEMNLCENCYETYKVLLEPTIEEWLFKPLSDWSNVESNITQMVMKLKGVFKTDLIHVSLVEDSNEKYTDKIDVKVFREIKYRWSFKKKIKYLKDEGVLQDSSYNLLYKLSNIRNKIHELSKQFSEQDLILFHSTSAITSQICHATIFKKLEGISESLKSNAEKGAKQLLSKINGE